MTFVVVAKHYVTFQRETSMASLLETYWISVQGIITNTKILLTKIKKIDVINNSYTSEESLVQIINFGHFIQQLNVSVSQWNKSTEIGSLLQFTYLPNNGILLKTNLPRVHVKDLQTYKLSMRLFIIKSKNTYISDFWFSQTLKRYRDGF